MAIAIKLVGETFNAAGLKKLTLDGVITPRTVAGFDLFDSNSWLTQDDPSGGDPIYNLVDGSADATVNTNVGNLTFDGKGFAGFSADASHGIILPAASKLNTANQGFISTVWLASPGQTQASAGNIAGYISSGNSGVWGIYYSNPNYILVVNGQSYNVPNSLINGSGIHQLAMAWYSDGVGGFKNGYFLDGVLLSEVDGPSVIDLPDTDPVNATLGDVTTANGLNNWFTGSIYRHVAEVLTNDDQADYVSDFVAKDWALNSSRF